MNIRTHTCGELQSKDSGKSVVLNGWVNTVRLHGQVVFVDLRDRYGKTQIVFNSEDYNGDFEQVKKQSMEDVYLFLVMFVIEIRTQLILICSPVK